MLEIMRNQAQSWIAKVILGGIALSFGLWGVGDYFTGNRVAYVAEVDGKPISDRSFSQSYDRQLNSYRAMLGQQFSKTLVEQLGVKDSTLQTMINRQLMLDEAARMGLVASDVALLSYVQNNPTFQQAGVFDSQRYHTFTRNMGFATPRDYEAETRVNLMIDALQRAIVDSAQVSDAEVRAQFEREFSQRTIAALMIDPENLMDDIKVDDKAAQRWYDNHTQNYHSKLKVRVNIVEINPVELAKDLRIDEEEVAAAYETRKSVWTVDGISKPLSEVHDALLQTLVLEKARDEAYELSQDLDNALGMEDSLKIAANSLGLAVYETEAIDRDQALTDALLGSDQTLLKRAFATIPGDSIDIIELDDGRFMAIESMQRIEPELLALNDVRVEVYEDARSDAAKDKAAALAKSLIAEAAELSPDELAQKGGYAKFISKPVRRNGAGDYANWLTADIIAAAFNTGVGQWAGKAVVTSRGLALVYVVEAIAGDDAVFEEEKAAIALEAAKAKGAVRFARWISTVRDRHEIVIHNEVLERI
ncbi:MAG: SurA N-terminal domain-containing protein [Mariprofundaceae bacterium]|nr:SurA N-terminal domain-containing protein [Mariprofundaceae bacterium]